jgi:hypothetical protein
LTIHNKRIITGRILTYRFKKDADTLVRRYRKLALDIYNDIYSESLRKKMAELPAGWLPQVTHFSMSFAGDYATLYFDGPRFGNTYNYGTHFNERDEAETKYVMLDKDRKGAVKYFDANDKFTDEYRELRNLSKDFESSLKEGYNKIQQAFRLSTTVQGLKIKWPEVTPFLGDLDTVSMVPALPLADLNQYFELPVID